LDIDIMADSPLEIYDLAKSFRGLQALLDYNLKLRQGELLGIIGPNGAGKTTLFNLITGVLEPTAGRIVFQGREITHLPSEAVCRLGIARTFQNVRLFRALSALENVRIGLQMHQAAGFSATLLSLPSFLQRERTLEEEAMHLLRLFGIEHAWDTPARNLAYGIQRRLEIASALATRPQVLLLDEPAAGMNPSETEEVMALIRRVKREFDLTIILIEHNMRVVMVICERIQALNYGAVIAEGTPEEIQNNERVIEAYLGESQRVEVD
jgi:branched-chain amino acid transport system ATP-binding protein